MKKEITIDGQTYVLKEEANPIEEVKNPIMEIKAQKLEWGNTCNKELNWEDAKKWCEKQGDGWRLPTRLELLEAYEQKIGGFKSNNYWSSTEGNSYVAWVENFFSGSQSYNYEDNGYYVRCIRSLDI